MQGRPTAKKKKKERKKRDTQKNHHSGNIFEMNFPVN